MNTSKCEAWTLLEHGMEPDPYHISVLEVEQDQLMSMLNEASRIAEHCYKSKVILDDELQADFDTLGTAIQNDEINIE